MSIFRACSLPLIILTLVLGACASAPPPAGKELPPGYLYKGKFLNIRSPNEKGWYLAAASHAGIEFKHSGAGKGETFSAQVTTFPLPQMHNTAEFMDFLKKEFEADTDPKRFTILSYKFEVSDARQYRCVNISAVIEDKQALASAPRHEKRLLQSIALYCRHPVNKLAGFAIVYSRRGKSLDPELSNRAKAFIAGVQVPGH